jgi:hypothetical protein
MKKAIVCILLLFSCLHDLKGQSGIRDSTIGFTYLGVHYGYYLPGGDMNDRFGNNSILGGNFIRKTKKNFLFGFSGGFIFGDQVNQPGLLDAIATETGQIIGLDGLYAEVRIFERGYHLNFMFGKVIPFKRPNPNSGLVVMGGPGFIQHKIRIENIGNTVPALSKDYVKGYDHLSNGISLNEFIGYVYYSNRQLVNFYGGFDFIQGFTENRRDYNFDSPNQKEAKRIDLLYGFKIGWIIPLYKKKPAAYYLY